MQKSILLGLAVLFALISCNKKDVLNDNTRPPTQKVLGNAILDKITTYDDMLVFSSFDHFIEALEVISDMEDCDRLSFENYFKFTSFGSIVDNFYDNIDFEIFQSEQEVADFITRYSYMFDSELIKGEEGMELSILPAMFSEPERWIMNNNKMYIVGNDVYRYFPEDTMVVVALNKTENINDLANAKDWKPFEKNENFICYKPVVIYDSAQDGYCDKPSKLIHKQEFTQYGTTDSKNRSRLIVEANIKQHFSFYSSSNYWYSRLQYTMVNEYKSRWLGFLWWYYKNVEKKVVGTLFVQTVGCRYIITNGGYYELFFKYPTWNFNHSFKKESNHFDETINYLNDGGAKPWISITIVKPNLSISNGITMNFEKVYY